MIAISATSFWSEMKSLSSGRPDAAHCLGDDDVAHRLALGQADRQCGVALPGMDGSDAGAVDLGDVGAVGERQRTPAQKNGLGRDAPAAPAPESRTRAGRSSRIVGNSAEEVGVDHRGQPRTGASQGDRAVRARATASASDQNHDLDDQEQLDVEPEAVPDRRGTTALRGPSRRTCRGPAASRRR